MSTPAAAFSEREHLVCQVARMIEGGAVYWVSGGGSPLYAILLAQQFYTPDAVYVTEDGVVAPEPELPFSPFGSLMSSRSSSRSSRATRDAVTAASVFGPCRASIR